jgi:hypothetical protein
VECTLLVGHHLGDDGGHEDVWVGEVEGVSNLGKGQVGHDAECLQCGKYVMDSSSRIRMVYSKMVRLGLRMV